MFQKIKEAFGKNNSIFANESDGSATEPDESKKQIQNDSISSEKETIPSIDELKNKIKIWEEEIKRQENDTEKETIPNIEEIKDKIDILKEELKKRQNEQNPNEELQVGPSSIDEKKDIEPEKVTIPSSVEEQEIKPKSKKIKEKKIKKLSSVVGIRKSQRLIEKKNKKI